MRESRKLDHIKFSLQIEDGPAANSFSDLQLVHNCLPSLAWSEINVACSVAGISMLNPIIINAITGGASDVVHINEQLAEFARMTGCTMAVGSQFAGIENADVESSYKIIKQVNPNGIVFANLGAYATPAHAQQAIDMIQADAIQIHLNPAQEIIMTEGDRDFSEYLRNIAKIVETVDVPVIVKEVGCGIAKEQAKQLIDIGVKAIDVGGAGGTNFIAIEAARKEDYLASDLLLWGIPTAISAIEVASVIPNSVDLIVSGGVRTPLDVVKALALKGKAVGLATPILKIIQQHGIEHACQWFNTFIEDIKKYMFLVGVKKPTELSHVPLVITGYSSQWLTARGIDITKYAHRSKT